MTTQNLKGHSRLSSSYEGLTLASTVGTDRYNVEAEVLDWTAPTLTKQHKAMYCACNKYKKDNAAIHYDYLASNYEGMYLRMGYPDPNYVAKYVNQFCLKNKWEPCEKKVLDLACGTGLIGQELFE